MSNISDGIDVAELISELAGIQGVTVLVISNAGASEEVTETDDSPQEDYGELDWQAMMDELMNPPIQGGYFSGGSSGGTAPLDGISQGTLTP